MTKLSRTLACLALLLSTHLPAFALTQTITFDAIPNQILGSSPSIVTARASSGLPVTFTSTTPAVCKMSGTLVIALSAGPCFVTASQAGNGTYSAATATRNFTVSQAKAVNTLAIAAGIAPGPKTLDPLYTAFGDFNSDGIQDLVVF